MEQVRHNVPSKTYDGNIITKHRSKMIVEGCAGKGVVLQLLVQTYHRTLQHFGTSLTNAYSTHFVIWLECESRVYPRR